MRTEVANSIVKALMMEFNGNSSDDRKIQIAETFKHLGFKDAWKHCTEHLVLRAIVKMKDVSWYSIKEL